MAKDNHLYHKPTQEGLDKIAQLRAKVIELDDLIDELMSHDTMRTLKTTERAFRSIAIAKTKLEECRHRAIEALVFLHNEGEV